MKRIAALVPNILGVSPGQRVRIETWANYLREEGWTVDFYPFEDPKLHEILYQSGKAAAKASLLMECYVKQLRLILQRPPCDILFIYREASLIGPAIIERLAKRLRVPIIYDLDDPVFLSYRSPMNGWFSLLKFPRKTHALFRLSTHVIAINHLIADHVVKFNPRVTVIPNCIDVERYTPRQKPANGPLRLVWMGSHSTMMNLATIDHLLLDFQRVHPAVLRVIGAGDPHLPGVNVEVRQWSANTEVSDLQDCDIGLLPIADLPWNPWKLFFKLLQYMAVGLPVVATRIGSNSEIIEHGVNGFLVESSDEWSACLKALAADPELRRRIGKAARETIIQRFSTHNQMPRMISTFDQVLAQN